MGMMPEELRPVILEYIRTCEAVLQLPDLSQDEETAVSEMLVRLSDKLYPE